MGCTACSEAQCLYSRAIPLLPLWAVRPVQRLSACTRVKFYRCLGMAVSRSHTTTHHSRQDSSGRVISASQRPLPNNTQHSQQTNLHAPGGIRTHNLSRLAAADLCLRPRGRWDRLYSESKVKLLFATQSVGGC